MPFDWREYYRLASSILGGTETGYSADAAARCAISRAYFAAFCWARNYAVEKMGFIRTDDERDHGRLRNHFKQANNFGLAEKLDDLRNWRNDCDYKEELDNLPLLKRQALQSAKEIINALTSDPAQKL
jgi:hypothetical protein